MDRADQLRVYYTTQRVHLKSWKPPWHWLLDTTIVNSYKLSFHALNYDDPDLPCERYTKQRKFRQDLVKELFQQSERLTTPHYDRSVAMADLVSPAEEDSEHKPYHKGKRGYCKACEAVGRKATARPAARKPLQELSVNSIQQGRRTGSSRAPRSQAGSVPWYFVFGRVKRALPSLKGS